MTSAIYFKMGWEKEMSKITFSGNYISLKELKEYIIETKNLRTGKSDINLDLIIKDAVDTTKEYIGDDTLIPKFSSVIWKRAPILSKPTKPIVSNSSSNDIISTVQTNSGYNETDTVVFDVIVPKNENVYSENYSNMPAEIKETSNAETNSEEEEMRMIREQSLKIASSRRVVQASHQQQNWNSSSGGGNECAICGKVGHFASNCTYRDSQESGHQKFSQNITGDKKIHGVPEALLKNIKVKDGVEVIAPSQSEYQRLVKEGGSISLMSNIDMSKVPSHFKCPLTNQILEDAIITPCCNKSVSDSAMRAALLKSNFQCPLCNKNKISPDELRPFEALRRDVEEFIKETVSGEKSERQVNESAMINSNVEANNMYNQPYAPFSFPVMSDPFLGMMSYGGMGGVMPGPYPGLMIDSFGVMLPFDPNLVPWDLLPREVFPPPVSFEVFTKEQTLQREFVGQRAKKQMNYQNKKFEKNIEKTEKPIPVKRPTCIHGRTEGFCNQCNGEPSVDPIKIEKKEKPKKAHRSRSRDREKHYDKPKERSYRSRSRSRSRSYERSRKKSRSYEKGSSSHKEESRGEHDQSSATAATAPKSVKCIHGRTLGYCNECKDRSLDGNETEIVNTSDDIKASVSNKRSSDDHKDRKRSRERDRSKDRKKSKDKERDKIRDSERDRERDRYRERDRNKTNDKERDRNRDYDRGTIKTSEPKTILSEVKYNDTRLKDPISLVPGTDVRDILKSSRRVQIVPNNNDSRWKKS